MEYVSSILFPFIGTLLDYIVHIIITGFAFYGLYRWNKSAKEKTQKQ